MTARHTPGPWFTFANGTCVGGPVGILGNPSGANTAGIAHCGMALRTGDELQANARLISAAPRPLEVCKAARSLIAADRKSFAECSAQRGLTPGDDMEGFVEVGGALFALEDAAIVAEYDTALQAMDEAIAQAEAA